MRRFGSAGLCRSIHPITGMRQRDGRSISTNALKLASAFSSSQGERKSKMNFQCPVFQTNFLGSYFFFASATCSRTYAFAGDCCERKSRRRLFSKLSEPRPTTFSLRKFADSQDTLIQESYCFD